MNNRAGFLGLDTYVATNINLLGKRLSQNPSPSEKERKLWKLLKEVRRRQAEWRTNERNIIQEQMANPDRISRNALRKATNLYLGLKERKCSYGDYVFNLAFPERGENYPNPIQIRETLPETIWSLAKAVEIQWPSGLKMARVDAIRLPDNTLRIIELNPCWVDNIAALQAFYESYALPFPNKLSPSKLLAEEMLRGQPLSEYRNIALIYCDRTDGCKRDEIYGLFDYLRTTNSFQEIVVASLREISQKKEMITVKGIPITTLYFNGTLLMNDESISQQLAIKKIKNAQQRGILFLAPAQFKELDCKSSLVKLSAERPDLFVKTVGTKDDALDLQFPVIAKPTRSESLSGIKIINNTRELDELAEGFVFQPMIPSVRKGIICYDSKTKIISLPQFVYEKINLWIIENKIVGALATYSTRPLISDAGYNLPLLLDFKGEK